MLKKMLKRVRAKTQPCFTPLVMGRCSDRSQLSLCPTITDDNVFLLKKGSNHMLKKIKVIKGCTVPSPLTWPSTKKFYGTKTFAMTGSVDICSVLLETQFVGTRLHVETTRILSVGFQFPLWQLPERSQSLTSNSL